MAPERTEQLRRLSHRLIETEENERWRLARTLHEGIGQNVAALRQNLNVLRGELPAAYTQKVGAHLNDCEMLLYATIQLIRDAIAAQRPTELAPLGLLAALTAHARRVADLSGLSITVSGTELTPRLAPGAEIMLFRIAQEALANVTKHASATEASVALEADPGRVVMTVADNGCGFDPAARLPEAISSLGMAGMRERAESIGARLRWESVPGRGTRVIVEAPRAARSGRA